MEKSTRVLFIVVLCILYIKWFYVFCIRYLKFHKGTIVFSYVSYIKRLYILYPNSTTRVLCLMYPIKWPYVFCTPKFHKGTIIILCILIRGFRCILYPKFQRVLRYLMYPMRLYVFCTCLYPKFHKGTYLASKIPTS